MELKPDFTGWATKNDIKCTDGRTIRRGAFKNDNGKKVPLVWNHQHDDVKNVLGHAILEDREEGVYAYGFFNDSVDGQAAKLMVQHGDIDSLSIYANQLKQTKTKDVIHGIIREVSLVLAGANFGAHIDSVMAHSDGVKSEDEGWIYTPEHLELYHACKEEPEDEEKETESEETSDTDENGKEEDKEDMEEEKLKHADEGEETVQDVLDTFNEKQKTVLYAIVGQAVEDAKKEMEHSDEGGEEMKHNLFEGESQEEVLMHSEGLATILKDGKRFGSLKESFLAHAEEYGIQNIEWLNPEAQSVVGTVPGFIKRQPDAWVDVVMNGVHKTPFSRIKMMFADITADEARAKGYTKGNRKTEEVFTLLKRSVTPTTIYKKQKLDRDDVIDITEFDVVSWIKAEMRVMLDEEEARAMIFGDGRLSSSDDKINEANIIPVIKDDNLYSLKYTITNESSESDEHAFIRTVVTAQDDYQGSGNITLFIRPSKLTKLLLMEDTMGHRLYNNVTDVAAALNVDRIVKVPASVIPTDIEAVALDLKDYNLGADKGGAVNMFDDFDIDYNQQKYLIETRASGALIKPFSAMVFKNA